MNDETQERIEQHREELEALANGEYTISPVAKVLLDLDDA